jgi:phospholipase/lecithinase/hemolysin
MRLEGCLLIASLSALSVPAAAWGAPLYSEMIVFGDSVSDTGNVHIASTALGQLPDPGFDGRLSNGPIWVDRLAERLGLASPSPSLTGGTNQGRCMKSAHQKRQHVLVIPGSLLATSVHADPGVRSRSKRYLSQ